MQQHNNMTRIALVQLQVCHGSRHAAASAAAADMLDPCGVLGAGCLMVETSTGWGLRVVEEGPPGGGWWWWWVWVWGGVGGGGGGAAAHGTSHMQDHTRVCHVSPLLMHHQVYRLGTEMRVHCSQHAFWLHWDCTMDQQ